jgi:hypothetical protein
LYALSNNAPIAAGSYYCKQESKRFTIRLRSQHGR